MGLFRRAMAVYPFVFHPITVLGVGILLIVRYEWHHQSGERSALWKRAGAFLGAGVLGLVPTGAYFLLSGSLSHALQGKSWQLDLVVAAGVYVAVGATWYVWRRYDWGAVVPRAMQTFAVVLVPYAVLSPFWDVSGHVLIALVPTLYLALLDRTYAPLLVVPVLMVPNRVVVNAHTWGQSIVAFVVAGALTWGLYRHWQRPSGDAGLESTRR